MQSVNADGSITSLEANRNENSANGGVPTYGTYTKEQVANMVFSNAPASNRSSSYSDTDKNFLNSLSLKVRDSKNITKIDEAELKRL